MTSANYKQGLEKLRELLLKAPKAFDGFQEIVDARDAVIARFQPLFSSESVHKLTAEQFKSFLLLKNNHHWTGLHRQSGRICAAMKKLRAGLALLLDEQKPVSLRWDGVIGSVPGMGKAIISAILLIAHPDQYVVWNNTSEAGLRALGLWPGFGHGSSSGQKYATVNALLNQLAKDLHTDLWALDSLFRWLKPNEGDGGREGVSGPGATPVETQSFGLEKHLRDFLLEDWDKTELGKDWAVYAEDKDLETAHAYPTDVGETDLLAKHSKQPRWLLVIGWLPAAHGIR